MHKFLFSLDAIPNVKIELVQKIDEVDPITAEVTPTIREIKIKDQSNGYLGIIPDKTKFQIRLEVEGEHQCFTLEPKTKDRVPKKQEATGKYIKNFSVDASNGFPMIAAWPANMICLEVTGHIYNIGIANQNGRFFFVIEEYLPSPENLPLGMVISFSLLRGLGSVAYKPGFDAKVHWKNIPFDKRFGLRLVQTGDILEWNDEDIVLPDSDTTYRYEVKKCTNLSMPK